MCAGLLTVNISAQTDQGGFLLLGSTGLDYSSVGVTDMSPSDQWSGDDESVTSSLEFEIQCGYFLADGLALGLSLGYKSQWQDNVDTELVFDGLGNYGNLVATNYSSQTTFIIAPALRLYFGESGAWAQTSYGWGYFESETEEDYKVPFWYGTNMSNDSKNTSPISVLALQAGYAIYLSEKISLNPTIGYSWASVTLEDEVQTPIYDSMGNVVYYTTQDLEVDKSGINFGIEIALHL